MHMQRVVLTLTTIPSRINSPESYEEGIKSNLLSLLNQSHDNYEIHLNVPKLLTSTGEEYIIPDWIRELSHGSNNKFTIFDNLEDSGPITKLLPTIERLTNPDDIIIVVDDDLVYHTDLVREQVNNQSLFTDDIIGYDGIRSRDNFFGDVRDYYYTSNKRNSRVDIIQHYKSVSYKRQYFETDFTDFVEDNFTWDDDLLISAYFSSKKRNRIVTFHPDDPDLPTLEDWRERGGVETFPVLRHTNHESYEGCNVYRQSPEAAANFNISEDCLYKKFIDNGY